MTLAPGTTAPEGSVTVPSSVPFTACPSDACEKPSKSRMIMDPRMGLITLFNVISASKFLVINLDPI
jgi:hypothetical protein